jgi:hypothetical protein
MLYGIVIQQKYAIDSLFVSVWCVSFVKKAKQS